MNRTKKRWCLALLILGSGAVFAASQWHEPRPSAVPAPILRESFQQNGFRVEVHVETQNGPEERGASAALRPGTEARIEFSITEALGAQPLSNVFPMAWLVAQDPEQDLGQAETCERTLRGLLAGRLARAAAVNFNEYYLVTRDDNNSLTIIDPQIESSKTKTMGMIPLPARPLDFVLAPDQNTLFATLGNGARLARASLEVRRASYLGLAGAPDRLAMQPGGSWLWVGDAEGPHVSVVDAKGWRLHETLDIGAGPHAIAFDAVARRAFVSAQGAQRFAAIDTQSWKVLYSVELEARPTEPVWAAHAGKVYVATRQGLLYGFAGEGATRRRTELRLRHPVGSLGASLDGRWLFALHPDHDAVSVMDSATDALRAEIDVPGAPVRVDFTETFAYLRRAHSERYVLVDLGSLSGREPAQVSEVPMGQAAPGAAARHDRTLVQLPEGGGALILNAADRSVYHFAEGMAAPMGSYQLYPWPASGVLLADRSLREVRPGVYQTQFRVPKAGAYRVAFLIPNSPKLYDCSVRVEVGQAAVAPKAGPLRVEALFQGQRLEARVESTLELRLSDAETGAPKEGLEDWVALLFRVPGWQQQQLARPLGGGRYAVSVEFPEAGAYALMLKSRSRGIEFKDSPALQINVVDSGLSLSKQEVP